MRKRKEKGLLGGMMEIPSTPWEKNIKKLDKALDYAPVKLPIAKWTILLDNIKHVFSHFNLSLVIASSKVTKHKFDKLTLTKDFVWVNPSQIDQLAIPSLTKKIVKVAKK